MSRRPSKTPVTPLSASVRKEDVDVDEYWKSVVIKCQSITKWDLNRQNTLSPQDVVDKINPPKKEDDPQTKEQAKVVFMGALTCIQRFGQFAAQSASVVFGPSQQCFNAVSFVVAAAQDYSGVFDNLTALMERMSAFLERLRLYLEAPDGNIKLDRRLRLSVYRVLDFFLVVMAHAHKLTTSSRAKLKLGVKVIVFGEDGGVKQALTDLERLISVQTQTEITVIVRDVSDAAKGIRRIDEKLDRISESQEKTVSSLGHLEAAEDRRADVDKERKEAELIHRALGVDDKQEPWESRHRELSSKRIDGTGTWLLSHSSYSRWCDPNKTGLNVLAIRAEQGFGKSVLASMVVEHLRELHRSNPRVCVAHFYLNKISTESRDSIRDSINTALKAILWQLTQGGKEASREFRKAVHRVLEDKPEISKSYEMWKRLITQQYPEINATFFIVLDGLDEEETEPGRPLAHIVDDLLSVELEESQLRVRFLLAGRTAGLRPLQDNIGNTLPTICLSSTLPDEQSPNKGDLIMYADARLNGMTIFNKRDPEIQQLKADACDALARGVRGDYFTLEVKLTEISKARNVADARTVLDRAYEDRTQLVRRQISELNETLTNEEIRDVNDLLMWCLSSYRRMNILELESMLRLDQWTTTSLVPLDEQIKDRYNMLFQVDDSISSSTKLVWPRSEAIEEALFRDPEQGLASNGPGVGASTSALPEAEVSLVERVVKTHLANTFGPGVNLYETYGFAEFFEAKKGSTSARIKYDESFAHVYVAQGCLLAICDHYDDPKISDLHDYAYTYFAEHLDQAIARVKMSDVDPLVRQRIALKLLRLLRDDSFINSWWVKSLMYNTKYYVRQTNLCDAMATWLKDEVVQDGLKDMPSEKKWLQSVLCNDQPSTALLVNVAKVMAKRWYDGKPDEHLDAIEWLHGYHQQLRGRSSDWDDPTASVGEVEEMHSWARKELPTLQDADQWHFCMGIALHWAEHYEEARVRLQIALDARPSRWRAQLAIARTYAVEGDTENAVLAMEQLDNSTLLSEHGTEFETMYWDIILVDLSAWYIDLDRFEKAEQILGKLLDRALQQQTLVVATQWLVYDILNVFTGLHKYSEAVKLITTLAGKEDSLLGNWAIAILLGFSEDAILHERILTTAKKTMDNGDIFILYQQTIERVSAEIAAAPEDTLQALSGDREELFVNTSHSALHVLQIYLGRLKWHCGSADDRNEALEIWERIAKDVPHADTLLAELAGTRRLAATILGASLLTQAKEHGLDSTAGRECVARLERIANFDRFIVCHPNCDIRLYLARAHSFAGDRSRAVQAIRGYLAAGLQSTPDYPRLGFIRAAYAFMAVNDDINALAALRLSVNSHPSTSQAISVRSPDQGTQPSDKTSVKLGQERNDRTSALHLDGGRAISDDGDRSHESSGSSSSENELEEGESTSSDEETTERSGIPCGACKTVWTGTETVYFCRDCILSMLCGDCWAKLKDGSLKGAHLCQPEHSHLLVPPIALEAWKNKGDGMIFVGDTVESRQVWEDQVMKAWDIERSEFTAGEKLVNAIRKVLSNLRRWPDMDTLSLVKTKSNGHPCRLTPR